MCKLGVNVRGWPLFYFKDPQVFEEEIRLVVQGSADLITNRVCLNVMSFTLICDTV